MTTAGRLDVALRLASPGAKAMPPRERGAAQPLPETSFQSALERTRGRDRTDGPTGDGRIKQPAGREPRPETPPTRTVKTLRPLLSGALPMAQSNRPQPGADMRPTAAPPQAVTTPAPTAVAATPTTPSLPSLPVETPVASSPPPAAPQTVASPASPPATTAPMADPNPPAWRPGEVLVDLALNPYADVSNLPYLPRGLPMEAYPQAILPGRFGGTGPLRMVPIIEGQVISNPYDFRLSHEVRTANVGDGRLNFQAYMRGMEAAGLLPPRNPAVPTP